MKIFSLIAAAVFLAALAIAPAGCSSKGGSSNSGGGSSGAAPAPGTGFVVFPQDLPTDNTGIKNSIVQSVQLFDSNGNPLSTPSLQQLWQINGATDIDGAAITQDGSHGVLVDGGNDYVMFFQVQNGDAQQTTGVAPLDLKQILPAGSSSDLDSVALMKNGDEAVISMDDSTYLLLVSGINSGKPWPAIYIDNANQDDGVALSPDNSVLLARGPVGLDVFAVNSISPTPNVITGSNDTYSHQFFWQKNLPLGETWTDGGGRDGMAFINSTSAVVISDSINGGGNSEISLVTGLPYNASVSSTSVSGNLYSVAISGDLVIVGMGSGLEMFSGVNEGALTYVGSISTYSNGSPIGQITTLQITSDGHYVVAGDASNGAILNIQMSPSGFGSIAGVLTGVQVPYDDEMMIH